MNPPTRTPSEMTVRPALPEDATAISALIIRSIDFNHSDHYAPQELIIWRRGYTPESVLHQINQRQCLVIGVGEALAGVVQFEPPEIKGFYVDPVFHGQGLGRRLLDVMLTTLAEAGHEQVELTSNKWVVGFYEKCGFRVVGEETVVWENHPFLEYRMIKQLKIARSG